MKCFNPLPPRGGRHFRDVISSVQNCASIHFPREGEDIDGWSDWNPLRRFNPLPPRGGRLTSEDICCAVNSLQSTSPARGKTMSLPKGCLMKIASIHFPREGEDCPPNRPPITIHMLQSTSPARGKTVLPIHHIASFVLQSTSPARGKTAKNTTNSIKALLTFVYYFYIYTNIPK